MMIVGDDRWIVRAGVVAAVHGRDHLLDLLHQPPVVDRGGVGGNQTRSPGVQG